MRIAACLLALGLSSSFYACKSTKDLEKRQEIAAKQKQEAARIGSGGDSQGSEIESQGGNGSDYLPNCAEDGLTTGNSELIFVKGNGNGNGFMELKKGDLFSCKKDENTEGDNTLPLCSRECPGAIIDRNGFGTCYLDLGNGMDSNGGKAKVNGFDCRIRS